MAFLGPDFVTGMCSAFTPNATQVWVNRGRMRLRQIRERYGGQRLDKRL
jgi:hypothetical protein